MDEKKITAYKGFDKDFKCRGFQYEVGREYEVTDKVECCESGFHACENPFDVWCYYDISNSRFALVEQSGEIDSKKDKTCSSKICIKEEIGLGDFIRTCVGRIVSKTRFETDYKVSNGYGVQIGSSGYDAKIGSSGNCAQIGSSGNDAQIGSSGYGAQIGSSGYGVQIGSSGYGAQIGSSGNDAKIGSSGNDAKIGSSGYDAKIGSSGNDAKIGSSGNCAQIGSSGNDAKIGSSGYGAQIGSSGNDAQIGSSGYGAKIGSSGNGAQIGSSGDCAQIKSEGKNCVICCAGDKSAARAKKGSWITLSEWRYIDDEWTPVCVKTERVDGVRIKEDTWYRLKNGEFVETKQKD